MHPFTPLRYAGAANFSVSLPDVVYKNIFIDDIGYNVTREQGHPQGVENIIWSLRADAINLVPTKGTCTDE
ncbi:MAG: hypothetical protein NVSMB38_42130 [Ktedonobacteraceae bacterium]